jgi:penicillin amidase
MLTDLQRMDGDLELGIGRLNENVPEEVFDFLLRKGSNWDAAIDGTTFEPPAIPPEEVWSLRDQDANQQADILKKTAFNQSPFVHRSGPGIATRQQQLGSAFVVGKRRSCCPCI